MNYLYVAQNADQGQKDLKLMYTDQYYKLFYTHFEHLGKIRVLAKAINEINLGCFISQLESTKYSVYIR